MLWQDVSLESENEDSGRSVKDLGRRGMVSGMVCLFVYRIVFSFTLVCLLKKEG